MLLYVKAASMLALLNSWCRPPNILTKQVVRWEYLLIVLLKLLEGLSTICVWMFREVRWQIADTGQAGMRTGYNDGGQKTFMSSNKENCHNMSAEFPAGR